jgi:MFS family permease
VLCFLAFLTIGSTGNIVLVVLGYSLLGGIGAGLVYATCINMVGKWYPERKGGLTGFVNGGFAYGSIPFIVIFNYWFTPANHSMVLYLVGLYMLVLMASCGVFFKDPPKNWWPSSVDPVRWSEDREARKTLSKNPPAVRQFTPAEAYRTPQIWIMWLALVCTSSVSFFGINFLVKFAKASDFALYVAVISAILLALVSGTGRAFVGWVSDYFGRRQTLLAVCVIPGALLVRGRLGGLHPERGAVHHLRHHLRVRRRCLLPPVRRAHTRLLRRELQRLELRHRLLRQAGRRGSGRPDRRGAHRRQRVPSHLRARGLVQPAGRRAHPLPAPAHRGAGRTAGAGRRGLEDVGARPARPAPPTDHTGRTIAQLNA